MVNLGWKNRQLWSIKCETILGKNFSIHRWEQNSQAMCWGKNLKSHVGKNSQTVCEKKILMPRVGKNLKSCGENSQASCVGGTQIVQPDVAKKFSSHMWENILKPHLGKIVKLP